MNRIYELTRAMLRWCGRDVPRAQHLLKVWSFARVIGQGEGLDARCQFLLESAALTHDIGIKLAEAQYGSAAGPYQEALGPGAARPMLADLGYSEEETDRICWLIGHHHTYGLEAGIDYQILLEADYLVNAFEEGQSREAAAQAERRFFQTATGKALLEEMYLA